MSPISRPDHCPAGHPLEWITGTLACCPCAEVPDRTLWDLYSPGRIRPIIAVPQLWAALQELHQARNARQAREAPARRPATAR